MSDIASEQQPVDKMEELRRAKEAIAGPVPLMSDQPDSAVTLPQGFLYKGTYQTEAEVRELTGADEEALARTKEFPDFFDVMLAHGTVRLGDFDMVDIPISERRTALQTLLIGERERLFLAIIQATYGDTKTIPFTCGNCQAEQEVDLILSEDLTVREVDSFQAIYTHTTRDGDRVEYRLANGGDQVEALKSTNTAEQNSIILSRCITKVNDGLLPDPMAYARRMTMKDRRAILTELVNHQPGVDLEVTLRCVRCQNEQRLGLGWADLFQS